MNAREVNFDGLVGLTHSYAGLASGNLASAKNALQTSNPRSAALEGLAKMKKLADLGIPQAVLPPHERPDLTELRLTGHRGSDAEVLEAAAKETPSFLLACSSASAMWTANAATVSPSTDTWDGRVHITVANMMSHYHRKIEAPTSGRILRSIFADDGFFCVHDPLPSITMFADEGAANHTRLAKRHGDPGVEFFVFGNYTIDADAAAGSPEQLPKRFRARQTYEASRAIARSHGLDPDRIVYAQQSPDAIDAGVFHNDVISVGNENVLMYHAGAFVGSDEVIAELDRRTKAVGAELIPIRVDEKQVSLEDAVSTYMFNSQLVTKPDGKMLFVTPIECQEHDAVRETLEAIVATDNPIDEIAYINVRQSMRNGGGPACLRLRVVLNDAELARLNASVLLTDSLYESLVAWVGTHYRDALDPKDLSDPRLLAEGRTALDELTQLLGLGSIYPFQL
ncbi:MAG: N-succinylarginine dihydrolase [bacterium]|nr:N-succinylarginine dihydrolase [bacterium]